MRIAVVVEADADARTAKALADRVLQVAGIDPEVARSWGEQLTWKGAKQRRRELGRKAHGKFNNEPGAPDAHATRSVLILLNLDSNPPDAVLLIRDADKQATGRRVGLEQARVEHESKSHLRQAIVIGLAIPKREAWVLIGFAANGSVEVQAMESEQKRLGFNPVDHPHRLSASEHGAGHDIKRCMESLGIDREREEECHQAGTLEEFEKRGRDTGLPEYFAEIRNRILPILSK